MDARILHHLEIIEGEVSAIRELVKVNGGVLGLKEIVTAPEALLTHGRVIKEGEEPSTRFALSDELGDKSSQQTHEDIEPSTEESDASDQEGTDDIPPVLISATIKYNSGEPDSKTFVESFDIQVGGDAHQQAVFMAKVVKRTKELRKQYPVVNTEILL